MAEAPGAVAVFSLLAAFLGHVRLGDSHEGNHQECHHENGHTEPEQRSHVGHRCRSGNHTHQRADGERGAGA